VNTTSSADGIQAVAGGIAAYLGVVIVPWTGSYFQDPNSGESDTRARLKDISVEQPKREDTTTWTGTVTWDTDTVDEQKQKDAPQQKPPVWSGGGRIEDVPVEKDIAGTVILNSAGRPFTSTLMIGRTVQQHEVVINRTKIDFPDVAELSNHIDEVQGKCNLNDWQNFAANTLSCDSVKYSEDYESGIPFWKLTYTFSQATEDQPDRTLQTFLDAGLEEIYDAGPPPKLRAIRDDLTGAVATQAVCLDGAGHKGDPTMPVYTTFVVRDTVDFAVIIP
jgi:hypothetical protein